MNTVEIKKLLKRNVGSRRLAFPDLVDLTHAQAELLATRKGAILLNNITHLSRKAASFLSKHRGALELKSLVHISQAAAKELVRGRTARGKPQPIEATFAHLPPKIVDIFLPCLDIERLFAAGSRVRLITPAVLEAVLKVSDGNNTDLSWIDEFSAAGARVLARFARPITIHAAAPSKTAWRLLCSLWPASIPITVTGLPSLNESENDFNLAYHLGRLPCEVILADLKHMSTVAATILWTTRKLPIKLPQLSSGDKVCLRRFYSFNPSKLINKKSNFCGGNALNILCELETVNPPWTHGKQWEIFLKRFSQSRKRVLYYPCSATSLSGIWPLMASAVKPDVCLFVDQAFLGLQSELVNMTRRFANVSHTIELLTPLSSPNPSRNRMIGERGNTASAYYFQMKSFELENQLTRRVDCVAIVADVTDFLCELIEQKVAIHDYVVDYPVAGGPLNWDRMDYCVIADGRLRTQRMLVSCESEPAPELIRSAIRNRPADGFENNLLSRPYKSILTFWNEHALNDRSACKWRLSETFPTARWAPNTELWTKQIRIKKEDKLRIMREADRGEKSIQELCRSENISEESYYRWEREILEERRAMDLVN